MKTLPIVLLAALAAPAHADDVVWAKKETALHARPGERAPVVESASRGDALDVLRTRGRWLKVRHGKRVGWVTRSQVERREADERKRSERSGFSGKRVRDAVKVTVEIDRVRGFEDPRTKERTVLDLARGDVVTVIGRGHDGWLLVEHERGGTGWIPASSVGDAGKFVGDPRVPQVIEIAAESPPASAPSRARVAGSLVLSAGAQTFQMRQSDATQSVAAGPIATLAAGGHGRVWGDVWAGVVATADLASAALSYNGAAESIATKTLAVDVAGEVRLGRARYLAARAGVHYATFSVDADRSEAMLLGERVGGATVGLAGGLPLGRRFAIAAGVDVMPAGAQKLAEQPAGVMYGTSVRGGWARGTLTVRLPAHLVAALSYRAGLITTELTDGVAASGSRTDESHTVSAGLGASW